MITYSTFYISFNFSISFNRNRTTFAAVRHVHFSVLLIHQNAFCGAADGCVLRTGRANSAAVISLARFERPLQGVGKTGELWRKGGKWTDGMREAPRKINYAITELVLDVCIQRGTAMVCLATCSWMRRPMSVVLTKCPSTRSVSWAVSASASSLSAMTRASVSSTALLAGSRNSGLRASVINVVIPHCTNGVLFSGFDHSSDVMKLTMQAKVNVDLYSASSWTHL